MWKIARSQYQSACSLKNSFSKGVVRPEGGRRGGRGRGRGEGGGRREVGLLCKTSNTQKGRGKRLQAAPKRSLVFLALDRYIRIYSTQMYNMCVDKHPSCLQQLHKMPILYPYFQCIQKLFTVFKHSTYCIPRQHLQYTLIKFMVQRVPPILSDMIYCVNT